MIPLGAALTVLRVARLSLAVIRSVDPVDPLDPVDQNPDDVRDDACDLVASDGVCSPEPIRIDPDIDGNSPNAGFLGFLPWLLLVALLALLVFLVVRALMSAQGSLGRGGKKRRRPAGDEDDDDQELISPVIVDRSKEPSGWRAEAERHRSAGEYRDAIRCRYRALVGDLARGGLIDEIPGRTTGEERVQLRSVLPEANPPFAAAADLFDGAWFGDVPVHEVDDDTFQALERDVLAAVSASRTARR
jgi:Domain of unknown function (DUF4129)